MREQFRRHDAFLTFAHGNAIRGAHARTHTTPQANILVHARLFLARLERIVCRNERHRLDRADIDTLAAAGAVLRLDFRQEV